MLKVIIGISRAHKPANTVIHTTILLKTFIAYQMCVCRSHLNKEIRQMLIVLQNYLLPIYICKIHWSSQQCYLDSFDGISSGYTYLQAHYTVKNGVSIYTLGVGVYIRKKCKSWNLGVSKTKGVSHNPLARGVIQ